MVNLHRSPLLMTLLMISGIAIGIGAVVSFVLAVRPETTELRNQAAGEQGQVVSLPSPWRGTTSAAPQNAGSALPPPVGILRYDNGIYNIGLSAGSSAGSPMMYRPADKDFTLKFRIVGISAANSYTPSPLIVYGDPTNSEEGVSLLVSYLSSTRPGEATRYSIGRVALFQGRHAIGQPLVTAELSQPDQLLINPVSLAWFRISVANENAQVEYSLDGQSWSELGQSALGKLDSARLELGMEVVSTTPELGPSVRYDNLEFQDAE